MKKIRLSVIFALCAAIALCAFALTACGDPDLFGKGSKMTLVIATNPVTEYEIDLSGKPVNVKVTELMDENEISYELDGTWLKGAGGLKEDAATGTYLYLYTSVEKDKDVTPYSSTVDYGGITLTNSGVGILDMTVEDGCIIYIGTIVFTG